MAPPKKGNWTLSKLPDEVLYLILEMLVREDLIGDEEDYAFVPPYEYMDLKSLKIISATSKRLRICAIPLLWRKFHVDSSFALLRLVEGVLKLGTGPYIRRIAWGHPDYQRWYSSRMVYNILFLQEQATLLRKQNITEPVHAAGDLLLSTAYSLNEQPPSSDEDLCELEAVPFEAEMMMTVLAHMPALRSLSLDKHCLAALHLPGEETHLRLARLTHLRIEDNLSIEDSLLEPLDSVTEFCLATQILDSFGPLEKLQVLDLSTSRAENPFLDGTSSWPQLRALSLCLDHMIATAGDGKPGVTNCFPQVWQDVFDAVPHLVSLRIRQLFETGAASWKQALEGVILPSSLKHMHSESPAGAFEYEYYDLPMAVIHCKTVVYIKCSPCNQYWNLDLIPSYLPPALTTLKIIPATTEGLHPDVPYILDFLETIQSLIVSSYCYPPNPKLRHICLGEQFATLCESHFKQWLSHGLGANENIIAAALYVDRACRDFGVALCGPSIDAPLFPSALYAEAGDRLNELVERFYDQ